ncbi:MAG TPA: response regulator transcription factor [Acidimicrobiales bacterium]|nr:response regulator transcription factor [Acidimicrobiales bacterium]
MVIIDHHRMVSDAVAAFLGQHDDITVAGTAADAESGVALVASLRPDVVLVAHRPPDHEGVQLARRIVADGPGTKVIILAARADKQIVTAALRAGCSGFLTQDKAARELVLAIRGAHLGGVYVPSSALDGIGARTPGTGVGADLTRRERHVLQLMADGYSNQAISAELTLSLHTVRNHVQRILGKLGAHSKLEAVSIAHHEDLVEMID